MGRPIRYALGEMGGFLERARYMVSVAEDRLKDYEVPDAGNRPGFKLSIRREPMGVCALISAWNVSRPGSEPRNQADATRQFPYMIQVNALIPALLAGNCVLLKPSPQTPSPADNITTLLKEAGLPEGVCQTLHLSLEQMDILVGHPKVDFVSFTGSVKNGYRVEENARGANTGTFKAVNLELGGKDPAYVREDCDPKFAAIEITDGGFFNSGQSCCAVERIYVHEKVYDRFVDELCKEVSNFVLGDPRKQETTLGPVVSKASAQHIRQQIAEAGMGCLACGLNSTDSSAQESRGAKSLVPSDKHASIAKDGTTYVAPQVLVNVDHSMSIMKDETL